MGRPGPRQGEEPAPAWTAERDSLREIWPVALRRGPIAPVVSLGLWDVSPAHVASGLWSGLRGALKWTAHHTGLPVVLVSGILLAASWRLFRHAARFAVEVTIAVAVLSVAMRLGWIQW
jgi:hypothetical protein